MDEAIPNRDKVVQSIKCAAQSILDNAEEYATHIPLLSEANIIIHFGWDTMTTITLQSVFGVKDGIINR